MPSDRSRAKSNPPSKSRLQPQTSIVAAVGATRPTRASAAVALHAIAQGSAGTPSQPAVATPRRSRRLSGTASDSQSEASFASTSQSSAPVTPATAVSAFASNPTTSRKSPLSPSRSSATRISTLALPHSTPSRVGAGGSSPSNLDASPASKSGSSRKAKAKAKAKATPPPQTSSSSPASSSAKGKRKASPTAPQQTPNRSVSSASGSEPSNKRQKTTPESDIADRNPRRSTTTSPYSLRPRGNVTEQASPSSIASTSTSSEMTGINSNGTEGRNTTRSLSAKPKTNAKSKRASASGSTSSSRSNQQLECSDESGSQPGRDDDDVHMSELSDLGHTDDAAEPRSASKKDSDSPVGVVEEAEDADVVDEDVPLHMDDEVDLDDLDQDENEDEDEDDEDDEVGHDHEDDDEDDEARPSRASEALGTFEDEDDDDDPEDEDRGASMFGLNLRAMAGYMSGLSTRFRSLLSALRNDSDANAQMVALQDLSELLSVSTEDTLAGYFPTDAFVKELIYILGGPKPDRADLGGRSAKIEPVDDDMDDEMRAVLAAAAAADMEDNGEKELLACRCLANLMEAMPYAAHSVVMHGAIPVLNSKLMEITFIDLAEQVLQTLEKVSQDYPSSIVKEGGLSAILQYLDFFNIHIQRTAMSAAANCCRKLTPDSLSMVKDVMPIIQNVLTYSDQRLVESACKCVVRVVESYRAYPDLLEQLLTGELLAALNNLLLPASSSTSSNTTLGASVYTDVLKALGTACRSSPRLAVVLLENNIVETLYHLLTGSPAPNDAAATRPHGVKVESEHASGPNSSADTAAVAIVPEGGADAASSSVAVADMAVLQNLAQRPKEQIQEALSLVGELLPPLPRDGVFDPRAYTEKAYLKRAAKQASFAAQSKDESEQPATDATGKDVSASGETQRSSNSRSSSTRSKLSRTKSDKEVQREAAQSKRVEMLQSRTALVKRFTHLVLPTLVEVYAASVALHVRHKAINGILKIISFVDAESLAEVLDNVPLASFLAAILSSRDHPTLINGALQIVELLTEKLPSLYTALLRREGVMWEIDDIASQTPSARPASSSSADKTNTNGADADRSASQPLSLPRAASSVDSGAMSFAAGSGLARLIAAASGSSQSGTLLDASGHRTGSSSSVSAFNAQISVEATDASIWRARVLRDKFEAESKSSEGAQSAAQALDHVKDLVKRLSAAVTGGAESEAREVLQQVSSLFSRSEDPISSFELLRSGLVDALYSFATSSEGSIPLERRRSLLTRTLMNTDASTGLSGATVLVRRLQEALSRLENVEITTALGGGSDEVRKSPSAMLGRQLRLRLQAEDAADIPRSCNNIIVSIHAVATLRSLSDYLRPKIAASSGATASGSGAAGSSASSRLSSVLAAFAAATGSGGFPELGGSRATESSSTTKDSKASSSSAVKTDGEGSSSSKAADGSAEKGKSQVKEGEASASGSNSSGKSRQDEAREDARALARHLFGDEAGLTNDGDSANKGKGDGDGDGDDDRRSDEALARSLMEGLLQGAEFEDDDGFSDEEGFEEEILQSEIPTDAAGVSANGLGSADGAEAADKTINLDVEKEGGNIVAKTPEGTRIATPSNGSGTPKPTDKAATGATAASGSSSATTSPSKPAGSSYASALQKKPTDWHLEFSLGSEKLTLDTTIYGAVHRFETSQQGGSSSSTVSSLPGSASSLHGGSKHIWSNVYTVKYKKVSSADAKPLAESTPEPTSAETVAVELPASIKEDAPHAKLLQLLAVLHSLNMGWRELSQAATAGTEADASDKIAGTPGPALAESAFVNNKLTAKLNRQLEEPMIVASACLPAWSTDLPKHFPFLFPFEARFAFLQSTSFGYARLLTRWQALHSRNQDASSSSSRLDDSFGFLGRLQRQKVRISRANLLASAVKVFELYGSNSSVLEVEYFEEVGTGLGPTLEFYSLVSKEFARRDLKLWRDSRAGGTDEDGSQYVHSPLGLFPAPVVTDGVEETTEADSHSTAQSPVLLQKRLQAFRILGQFVAKALLDSRIIDCNFSPIFMRAVLHQHVVPTLATLSMVDPTLARSLASMREMKPDEVESLGLDFTVPGYDSIELHPGGRDENVTGENVEQYISEVLDMTLHKGIRPAVRAFHQGFNLIFPIAAMSSFTADELVMLFGNTEEDWSEATLLASVKPDHGFNADSPTFRDIIAIMASFDVSERREFLQWLTGSPKLPIGGFAGLHPQLTIVKRPHEAPLTPDDYLPSVMTCVNYLKMPNYSSREKMRERLQTAMKEGSTSFHLS